MEKYKLNLTTLSNVLISSGKSATLIDTDIEFHKTGFPFIRARTIKGLLKESVEEVCEIENRGDTKTILEYFFGKPGWNEISGKLRLDNFYLQNWSTLKAETKSSNLTSSQIINEYTGIIQQTAIDENEIAKDTSLRTYRFLKPNIVFEGMLEVNGDEHDEILDKAIINLRYAGVRRNRGLGRIRIEKSKLAETVKANDKIEIAGETKLSVKLTTRHPLVLGLQLGDQNTINTQKYLSGNQSRGLFISVYLKSKKNSFDRNEFFDLFISGKLTFSTLYFNNATPLPLNIHYKKTDPKNRREPVNVFGVNNEITKPYGGMVSKNGQTYQQETPDTTLFFHNSREDRTAGKSTATQEVGGIFYYEAIDEDQAFEGTIEGDYETLKKLALYIPANFETVIGKSRSAQYGKAEINLKIVSNERAVVSTEAEGLYIIKLETPLILFNENGFPECTEKSLLRALGTKFAVEILTESAAGFTRIEQYNQKLESKSGKLDAYKEGSVFVVKSKNTITVDKSFYLGHWNEQGFGKCSIEKYEQEAIMSFERNKVSINDREPVITHPELMRIKETANKDAALVELKINALNIARHYTGLKNHLIGRLIYAFEHNETAEGFTSFIKDLQGKPAGEALKKKRLCTPDGDFQLDIVGNAGYNMQKEAWLLLLQTTRKLNKKENG
jgi:CRISPR-associated protein Csx10